MQEVLDFNIKKRLWVLFYRKSLLLLMLGNIVISTQRVDANDTKGLHLEENMLTNRQIDSGSSTEFLVRQQLFLKSVSKSVTEKQKEAITKRKKAIPFLSNKLKTVDKKNFFKHYVPVVLLQKNSHSKKVNALLPITLFSIVITAVVGIVLGNYYQKRKNKHL